MRHRKAEFRLRVNNDSWEDVSSSSSDDDDDGGEEEEYGLKDDTKEVVVTKAKAPLHITKTNTTNKKKKTRSEKNKPLEVSSRAPISAGREQHKNNNSKSAIITDPRFNDLTGSFNAEGFAKAYSFLNDYRESEKSDMNKEISKLKKKGKITEAEGIESELKRMESQDIARRRLSIKHEALKEIRQKQREQVAKTGKMPYFPKQSELNKRVKDAMLRETAGKSKGAQERVMAKRQKREAAKEKKNIPSLKQHSNAVVDDDDIGDKDKHVDNITPLKETPPPTRRREGDRISVYEGQQQQQQQEQELHERAMQRVLLERRALSRDMVRLQDSLMAKTQENLLLRGKLGIAELELDRKDEVTKECIAQIKKLHTENNRLQCILDTAAVGSHIGKKNDLLPASSSLSTIAGKSNGEDCCGIIPQSKPMSAEEEYFRMVVLAAKLNSTYLDNLGLFDPKHLYQRACEEKIYRPLAGPSPNAQQCPIGGGGTRGTCCVPAAAGGDGTNGSGGGGFFGNRLQLPDRVNGIFSSISKKVTRQSHHDTPKAVRRRSTRRRRAASLEITPRGLSRSSEDEEEEGVDDNNTNDVTSPEGGMSKSSGKAAAVMNRNYHYRKQVSTAAAVH
ncbi:rRNA bioproteinsis protein rrp36 [Perkinsus chesapeaki]|uniref:rRNA bioproteinsis protein rrp36 n=1 Tax=Perkinsus chesapeaki TaxID=330153 RepID=A0A7J6MYC3_PERCH|nr:rRNA bioproteinsis protein rrp36 [Perkinsus chesapeaki]